MGIEFLFTSYGFRSLRVVFIRTGFDKNLIAVYIFLCSIRYFYERKFIKYLLFCLIAALFHYSSFLLIPLYFCNRSFSNRNIIVAFVIANLLLLNADWVFSLIGKLLFFLPQIPAKIENYTVGDEADTTGAGKIISLGYFIHVFFFIIILMSRKEIEKNPYGNLIFNMGVLYIFIFRLGLTYSRSLCIRSSSSPAKRLHSSSVTLLFLYFSSITGCCFSFD